ncbi:thiol:disulfide interchange protein DsbA/DsbL [Neptunomonas antarctica]|uniref:Thiol:disulfide interchange protein n=1 Tax=Neptunomonas antarctica TaxID=619304 RepID=A0A1N7IRG7_9GAMM|nr:thiol:disulfide interchange protein DsbA/DsbL [Neptunomonas antarctica]SIS39683.1 thiol:disulfide interchange protein DsbA [Neptunomonas antarctica]
MWKTLLSVLFVFGLNTAIQAADENQFEAGKQFVELPFPVKTVDASKVEVTELFGYPCPHCNSFEPMLAAWEKQQSEEVDFQRVPVVFGRSWEPLARAYYTAELLNGVEQTHQAMFDAIHLHKKRFKNVEDIAAFYAEMGIDKAKFEKTYGSFAVNTKMNQGESKVRGYQVDGVPSLVVNGKYRVTAAMAGGHQQMLDVVSYLVAKEQKLLAE